MSHKRLLIPLSIIGVFTAASAHAAIEGDSKVLFCDDDDVEGKCIVKTTDAQDPAIEFTSNCYFDKGGTPLQYQANDSQPAGKHTSKVTQTLSFQYERTYSQVNNTLITSTDPDILITTSDLKWSGCDPNLQCW